MGLHDIETMNLVTKNLKEKVSENIFVHGEPWTAGTTPLLTNDQSAQINLNKFEGFGAFDDKIRDSLIKGGLSGVNEKGWAKNTVRLSNADQEGVKRGILGKSGASCEDPLKATMYVTCHDNYTLYDRIVAAYTENGDTSNVPSDEKITDLPTFANSVVFTYQGTSFMLAGEEFLRTKGGDHNSYTSGYKVNKHDYSRLIDFLEVYENYKKLIDFKQEFSGLQYKTAAEIQENVKFNEEVIEGVIDYTITSNEGTYRIIHVSPAVKDVTIDLTGYNIEIDTMANESSLENFNLLGTETLVLRKTA